MSAGSGPDLIARGLAPHLAVAFGQPFLVENRPGGGGTLAAGSVARGGDDHSLAVVLGGPTTTARALNPGLGYDPATAFTPVSLLTRVPFILVVPGDLQAGSVAAFLALAAGRPGVLSYASVGPGTVSHLAMEELKHRLGLDIAHVPYRGFPEATADLLAGRVQAMFSVPSVVLQHLSGQRLRALVQTGEARLPTLPDLPTLAEAGLPGDPFYGWTGLFAPAGFPPEAAQRLAVAIRRILSDEPSASGGLAAAGNEILGTEPAALALWQRREATRWNAVVARLGLRVTD